MLRIALFSFSLFIFVLQMLINNINIIKYLFILIHITCFLILVKNSNKLYTPTVLFYLTFSLFLVGRIYLSIIFENFNPGQTDFFTGYVFGNDIQKETYFLLTIFIIFFTLGSFDRLNFKYHSKYLRVSKYLYNIGYFLTIIGFIGFAYQYYFLFLIMF
ncbi:hypothetical protein MASR2M78_15630 [Treponema sp.]